MQTRRPPLWVWIVSAAFAAGAIVVLVLTWPSGSGPQGGAVLRVVARLRGASPAEVERLLAVPLEARLASLTGITHLRSVSSKGRVIIRADVADEGRILGIRARAARALGEVRGGLPANVRTALGPSGRLGFRYTLRAAGRRGPVGSLHRIQERVGRGLLKIPGVEAVRSCGGARAEMSVRLDPGRLAALRIHLDNVVRAVRTQVGESPSGAKAILAQRRIASRRPSSLGDIVVSRSAGAIVRLRDLGTISLNAERAGCTCLHGTGDLGICGLVLVAPGANLSEVARAIRRSFGDASLALPSGAQLDMYGRPDDRHALGRLEIRPPRGSDLPSIARGIARRLLAVGGVRDVLFEWGSPRYDDLDEGRQGIDAFVRLEDKADAARVYRRVEMVLAGMPALAFRRQQQGLPLLRVIGPDRDTLIALARRARKIVQGVDGVHAVLLSGTDSTRVVEDRVDRSRMAALGISATSLRTYLRAASDGIVVPLGAGEHPLRIRIGREPGDAGQMRIPTRTGNWVPILNVAARRVSAQPLAILRHGHRRCVSLAFRLESGREEALRKAIASALQTQLAVPKGYELVWAKTR